jgi:hypothetical protein
VVPPSFGTSVPHSVKYLVAHSSFHERLPIPSSLITVECPAQSTSVSIRCATPRSIQHARWCRLTPNPALCTPLACLLVLFKAFLLCGCCVSIKAMLYAVKRVSGRDSSGNGYTNRQDARQALERSDGTPSFSWFLQGLLQGQKSGDSHACIHVILSEAKNLVPRVSGGGKGVKQRQESMRGMRSFASLRMTRESGFASVWHRFNSAFTLRFLLVVTSSRLTLCKKNVFILSWRPFATLKVMLGVLAVRLTVAQPAGRIL